MPADTVIGRQDQHLNRRLTESMRDTLEQASRGPLRRSHDTEHGRPPWPAPWQTLHALVNADLLARTARRGGRGHTIEEWTITDTGRLVLDPPTEVVRERPLLLSARPARVRYRTLMTGRVQAIVDEPTVGEVGAHSKGDYTSSSYQALPHEPEAIDPELIGGGWFGRAAASHADTRDRREHARRLADTVRTADTRAS